MRCKYLFSSQRHPSDWCVSPIAHANCIFNVEFCTCQELNKINKLRLVSKDSRAISKDEKSLLAVHFLNRGDSGVI
jgi:hypothetical protein